MRRPATDCCGQGLAGEAELTAAFNAARDREYGDVITGCDDAADAPEAMAAACDFRYKQLCGKQAGLDQLARCYRALRDRDLLRAGQAEAAAAPHRA
ncbi:MAG: Chromate resistance protein ChrB [Trebonia sp.]